VEPFLPEALVFPGPVISLGILPEASLKAGPGGVSKNNRLPISLVGNTVPPEQHPPELKTPFNPDYQVSGQGKPDKVSLPVTDLSPYRRVDPRRCFNEEGRYLPGP
jgi:hypothetical protein